MQLTLSSVRQFAHEHDDIPAFHAGFLILVIFCALYFPVGAFALLVAIHACLDVVKYREVHGMNWRETCEGVVREGLFDIMLVFLGLASEVYLHSTAAVTSISGLLRTEFFFLELVGSTLPKFVILHNLVGVFANLNSYLLHMHRNMHKRTTNMEKLCVTVLSINILLILGAPFILSVESGSVLKIVLEQLFFWRL